MTLVWPITVPVGVDSSALTGSADRAALETMATEFLWNWTGRVYGLTAVSLRPCRLDCVDYSATQRFLSSLVGGTWGTASVRGYRVPFGCGTCGTVCRCNGSVASLRLAGPVNSVDKVRIDGAVLDPTAYRLDNHSLLVRTDGERWPTCQDLNLPADAEGTWQVDYTYGLDVPEGGRIAAGLLAVEFAKAVIEDDTCQLPQRVQTITRQGVTMTMLDAFEDMDKGHTGIWLVDSWVTSVTKPRAGATVRSPDVPRRRYVGG